MAKQKKKTNSRIKANRLVSKYITEIALEKTELIKGDDGEDRMGQKAEALARIIWKNALGYKEFIPESNSDIIHPPNLAYMKILLERMEGKIQDVSAVQSKKSVADRIKETTKSKLNNIARKS